MSIKINHIDLHKGEHIFVRFNGYVPFFSAKHSIAIGWSKKDDLPTVSGPFNCKSKEFKISIHGMELVESEDEAINPSLELKVARILKDSLTIGDFDNKEPWEERLIEEWVHAVYMRHNEDEELEVPWNL